MKLTSLTLAGVLLFCNFLNADNSAFSFLKAMTGPRAAALGLSYTAIAQGAETLVYNPAGLFQKPQHNKGAKEEFYSQGGFFSSASNIKNAQFAYVKQNQRFAWALSGGGFHISGLKETVADPSSADGYREISTFSSYSGKLAATLAYQTTENLALGISGAYLRESLKTESGNGASLDFGAFYHKEASPLSLGASIQNVGPKVNFKQESFDLPLTYRLGIVLQRMPHQQPKFLPVYSLISFDLYKPNDENYSFRTGIEVPIISSALYLRSGYDYKLDSQSLGSFKKMIRGFSLGVGFASESWSFDFASMSQGDLGLNYNAAFSYYWE